ncbi:hypothetical protein HPG69_002836 [Diceros bicornis minor]|uniref:PWWP domain-containing protein n=1 Tax=Diceros bicornis minor TaxID=77932 RepID=A0A7J7EQW0_DICBM|nr:hypothetical protein HPG69_002836 [Diceros bicornis minor]
MAEIAAQTQKRLPAAHAPQPWAEAAEEGVELVRGPRTSSWWRENRVEVGGAWRIAAVAHSLLFTPEGKKREVKMSNVTPGFRAHSHLVADQLKISIFVIVKENSLSETEEQTLELSLLVIWTKEYGKGPKKTFAPPAQKLHSLMPCSSSSPKEETLGISASETEDKPSLPKARLKKKEKKATTENNPSSGQEKKGKAQDNKQAEKKEKEKSSLTNAEFEEIIQIVLQKSLQECLGMGSSLDFPEISCAQPIRCTQLDKEPGIASSTADNDNADGEMVMVPRILEISASQEDGIIPEIKTSKPGQPDPAPSEKKFNRLSSSKRKKEAQDEKMEKAQSGHDHRQKDQLKKAVQDNSQIRDQQKGEGSGFDLEYNRCDVPEETWTGHESDVAYASYIPGSIIWAKQYGYPWWPGMIESDPDLGEYFLFASHLDSLPSKYHVTFFGETVSRAWIPVNMLKNFQELSLELTGVKKYRNKDCSQKLGAALMMAQEAEKTSIQERVNVFGFQRRYNGSDNSGEGKDLMLSGANSPDSCLEKEEEESEVEEEKEEKKDPTLPSPTPAKIQTKKAKAGKQASWKWDL